jgi:hypothetical protein
MLETSTKTRCKKCFYSKSKVTDEPCSVCSEIHYKSLNYQNHFIPSSKDFLKEEK